MNPKRILSVVPSITELLFDLGVGEQLVGRTKFCVHPKEKITKLPIIGGTKNLNLEKIKQLSPDLIIANKEENIEADITYLAQFFEVWVTEIATIEDSFLMISQLGQRLNQAQKATEIIVKTNEILRRFSEKEAKKALYLIWRKPYMSVGKDTFIHDMMQRIGFENYCKNQTRYPEIEVQNIDNQMIDLVLLSSEPFPFKEKHIKELQLLFPKSEVKLVDGEFFSWYGSRVIHLFETKGIRAYEIG
jgi:ABC-type Fe3+-hydroxamate transport system substrate-binding protein